MTIEIDPLEETLPLLPYEPAASLASRLAAFHRAGNAREFCWDHGMRFEKVAGGDPLELARFSDFAGADLSELARWTPRTLSRRRFTLNGEVITSFRSRKRRLRLCPGCVQDDLAMACDLPGDAAVGVRAYALIDSVRTCPVHGLGFVQIADQATFGGHGNDYAIAVDEALEDFEEIASQGIERKITRFESYFLGRLGVLERRYLPLLDSLEISQATTICERLGVLDLHGRRAVINHYDEDGRLACGEAGFGWLERGEVGVQDFVTMAHDRAFRDGCTGMSNAIFGRFHYFLTSEGNRPEFEPIRQLVVDRLSELIPYGPEDPPLFGVRPARRHLHTLISAERSYGVSYRTIKKLVEEAGVHKRLNLDFSKTRFAIGVDELDALLLAPEKTMTRADVTRRTGIVASDLIALEATGLLKPAEGAARSPGATYRRGDVEEIERVLLGNALDVDEEREGWATVGRASLATSWSRSEVYGLVASGKVAVSTIAGARSISSLRVSIDDLHRVHPTFGKDLLSREQAAAALGVAIQVVANLVREGRLAAHIGRGKEGATLGMKLVKDEVAAFALTYIPISEVWRRRGGRMGYVKPFLLCHGLEPAFPPKPLRCTFYLRAAVDQVLPPPDC